MNRCRERCPHRSQRGFGMVEALVAMLVLAVAAITALQLFGGFSRSFLASRQRDAIATLVSADLAQLDATVQGWCRVASDGSSGCSGTLATSDWQGSYNPPLAACDASTLAETMVAADPGRFPATATLTVLAADPAALQGVVIRRSLSASGNSLQVGYEATAGTTVVLHTRTTLVPEALGWCP